MEGSVPDGEGGMDGWRKDGESEVRSDRIERGAGWGGEMGRSWAWG